MPSSKAVLRQIFERNLNPKKAYTKSDIGGDGHIKKSVTANVTEPKLEEVKSVSNEETLKEVDSLKKSVETEENSVSTTSSVSKSSKHVKSGFVKTVVEVNKVKASTTPPLTGDKASDENVVESKKDTVSQVAASVGVDESTKLA